MAVATCRAMVPAPPGFCTRSWIRGKRRQCDVQTNAGGPRQDSRPIDNEGRSWRTPTGVEASDRRLETQPPALSKRRIGDHEVAANMAMSLRAAGSMAVIGGLLWAIASVRAGPVDDCNQTSDLGRQLRGCTAYIDMGIGTSDHLAIAHINRGNVYAQRRQHGSAIGDYAAAMALNPNNPLAPYNRGNLYFDLGQYDRAIADYSQALAMDPEFALALLNRGLARERQGDHVAARQDYSRAIALDSTAAVQEPRTKHRLR